MNRIPPEVMEMLLAQQEPQGGGQFPFSPSYGIEPAPEAPQRSAWDSIAMGLASGLPQMPAARGAGGAFAQGLARGFAMPRAAQVRAREEGAAATAEDRRKQISEAARSMRSFQHELRLEAAKAAMKPQREPAESMLDKPFTREEALRLKRPELEGVTRRDAGLIPKPDGDAGVAKVRIPGVGEVPATSGIAQRHLEATGVLPREKSVTEVSREAQKLDDDALVEQTAYAIANFQIPPELSSSSRAFALSSRIKNRANELLRESKSKYSYDDLVRMSYQQKKFQGDAMNSARMSQLRQSASTVLQHMDQWDELWNLANEKLRFSPIRPTNEIVFTLAKNGLLGEEAAAYAVALGDVTSPAVAREAAYVLSGGYAPYEQDVTHSKTMVAPWLGGKVHERQYKALRDLLRARLESAVEGTPYAGGADNPYLLEPSPLKGWERKDRKKRDMSKYEGN